MQLHKYMSQMNKKRSGQMTNTKWIDEVEVTRKRKGEARTPLGNIQNTYGNDSLNGSLSGLSHYHQNSIINTLESCEELNIASNTLDMQSSMGSMFDLENE